MELNHFRYHEVPIDYAVQALPCFAYEDVVLAMRPENKRSWPFLLFEQRR
jgi:hypothetical protein